MSVEETWMRFAAVFAAGLVLLLALLVAASPKEAKNRARAEYEKIEENISEEKEREKTQPDPEEPSGAAAAAASVRKSDGQEAGEDTADPEDAGLPASLWDELSHENSDLVGVLEFPVLSMSYPVVQGSSNTEYLSRTFSGTESPSGCIFLDAGADPLLTDQNAFLFGHCMRDGTMFGSLKTLAENTALTESCQDGIFFRVLLEDRTASYRVIAFHPVDADDEAFYRRVTGGEAYSRWLLHALDGSWYNPGGSVLKRVQENQPELLILSTCWGTGHTQNFIVIGARDEEPIYRTDVQKGGDS